MTKASTKTSSLFLFIFLLLQISTLSAQTWDDLHGFSDCGDGTHQVASTDLRNLCNIPPPNLCQLNGYTTTNAGIQPTTCPISNDFCGSGIILDNSFWIAFEPSPGVTFVEFEISDITCSAGGIQLAIIEIHDSNCETGTIIHCSGGSGSCFNRDHTFGANVIPGGLYLIQIDGCASDICTFTINVLQGLPAPPAINLNLVAPDLCSDNPTENGAIFVTANPAPPVGQNYKYTFKDPFGNIIPNPDNNNLVEVSGTGEYTVCVEDPTTCCDAIATTSIMVSENIPEVILNTPSTLDLGCNNSTVTLDATPIPPTGFTLDDYAYGWYDCNGVPVGPNPSFPGNSHTSVEVDESGCYRFIMSNTNDFTACGAEVEVVVEENNIPPIAIAYVGNNQILDCNVTEVTLIGNNSTGNNLLYSWTGPSILSGSTTSTAIIDAAGVYTLNVTDATNGCTSEAIVTVREDIVPPDMPIAIVSGILDCQNLSVMISGTSTTSNVSYEWTGPGITGGGTTLTATVNAIGTYTLIVTAANGCTNSATVEVVANIEVPDVNAGADQTIDCSGSDIMLMGTDNGTGIFYEWTGPSILNDPTELTVNVNSPGTYTLTVTAANGCTSTDEVEVLLSVSLPTAEANILNNEILTCNTPEVTLVGISEAPNAFFMWTGPNNFTSVGNQTQVSTPGIYTLIVTDPSNGCTNEATIAVIEDIVPPDLTVTPMNPTISCSENSVLITVSSNTPNLEYSWSDGTIGPLLNATVGQYNVTVTASNGCTTVENILVDQGNNLDPTITGDADICAGSTTLLSLTEIYETYLWSTGDITPTITVSTAGTYNVTVTRNGCEEASSFEVNEWEIVTDFISGSTTFCSGSSTILDAGMGFDYYEWSTGATTQSIQIDNPGAYSVTITDANTCTNVETVMVTESDQLEPIIAQSESCNETILLSVGSGFDTYEWSTGETESSIIVNTLETYYVTVTDNASCTGEVCIDVETLPLPLSLTTTTESTCGCKEIVTNFNLNSNDYILEWTSEPIAQIGNLLFACQDGTYELTATNLSNGCISTASIDVTLDDDSEDEGCVWPGDTNIDGEVNAADCLNIGLGKGTVGTTRPGGDVFWRAQYPLEWAESTPSTFVNYMHVDASGQGEIGVEDFTVVKDNWGLTHNFTNEDGLDKNDLPTDPRNLVDIPFYVQSDTLIANEVVSLPIILGEEAIAVEGFYGMVFSTYYDPAKISILPDALSFEDSWLGTLDEDLYALYKDFPSEGRLEIGITRFDKKEVNGQGLIARLNIQTQNITQDFATNFSIGNIKVITAKEFEITTAPKETTTVINAIITSNTAINTAPKFDIYPTPAQHKITIENQNTIIEDIEIYSITGQQMSISILERHPYRLDLSNYKSGLYVLKIKTKGGEHIQKVMVH